jgi:hypothetical protein
MSATSTPSDWHSIDRMAMARCRVAHDAAVALPLAYAQSVAATASVPGLGSGVVIRIVREAKENLPVVGYADRRGQWYRDGGRHVEAPAAEDPVEVKEMGL